VHYNVGHVIILISNNLRFPERSGHEISVG